MTNSLNINIVYITIIAAIISVANIRTLKFIFDILISALLCCCYNNSDINIAVMENTFIKLMIL